MTSTALLPMALLVMVSTGCLLTGAVLLWRGLWPKRTGDTRYCRACEFNLTGLESDRCPECGAALTAGAIVVGRRVRRPGLIAAGGLLLILAVGAGGISLVPVARSINWYALRPDRWVLADLQSSDRTLARKAWKEFDRRFKAGGLSESVQQKLITFGLAVQAASGSIPVRGEITNHLGRCYAAGQLSEAQEKRFFEQMARMKLEVRPRIALGDWVPFRITHSSRGPRGMFSDKTILTRYEIDGSIVGENKRFSSGRITPSGGRLTRRFVRCRELGKHTLRITILLQIIENPLGLRLGHREALGADLKCLWEGEVVLTGTFEVLDIDPEKIVRRIPNEELADAIRASIRPKKFKISSGKDLWPSQASELTEKTWLQGALDFRESPVNVGFDFFVVVGGKEYHMCTFAKPKGLISGASGLIEYDGPIVDSCDVVLRTSTLEVRRKVDVYDIWDGELIYEDVPVEIVSSEPRAE